MHSEAYQIGANDFLQLKNCNAVPDNIGDIVLDWSFSATIDREWLKGYMDALIEYMQQNNLENI